jgi:homospermidine synthase
MIKLFGGVLMIYSFVFADDIKYVKTDINEKQLKNLVEEYYKLKDKKGFVTFAFSKGVKVDIVELASEIKNIFVTHIRNIVD